MFYGINYTVQIKNIDLDEDNLEFNISFVFSTGR